MAGLADAAAELEALAFRLRRAGDTELLREVNKAMRDAVGPCRTRSGAGLGPPNLPDRYAAELDADVRLGVNVRTNERDPGVALTAAGARARPASSATSTRAAHPSRLRQPGSTGGPRKSRPAWFTGPAEAAGPRVRAGIERALEDVAAKAVKGG